MLIFIIEGKKETAEAISSMHAAALEDAKETREAYLGLVKTMIAQQNNNTNN